MAKKTCECCEKPKTNLKTKTWNGRTLLLCETCQKRGSTNVLGRIQAREAAAAGPDEVEVKGPATEVQNPPAAGPELEAEKPAKKAKAPKEPKPERVTVASTIRGLVDEGKTNAEIWAVIQPRFTLSDDKRWYPSWYRNQYANKKKAAEGAKAEG